MYDEHEQYEALAKGDELVSEANRIVNNPMSDTSNTICVKLQREGFHRWLDAPHEVKYLRNYHRHVYHIKAELGVGESRELEYFMVQYEINRILDHYIKEQEFLTPDYMEEEFNIITGQDPDSTLVIGSCEQFANWLVKQLELKYGRDRYIKVSVSEDGENGSSAENYY